MEQNQELKVSDWSQKYKLVLFSVFFIFVIAFTAIAVKWGIDIKRLLTEIAHPTYISNA